MPSTVTVLPAAIITSSVDVGTPAGVQVAELLQLPVLAVLVAENDLKLTDVRIKTISILVLRRTRLLVFEKSGSTSVFVFVRSFYRVNRKIIEHRKTAGG